MPSVVVLGGGMGGLAAADELSSRGFEVSVYEKLRPWGGKARSLDRWGTGKDGRPDLPGEHGFRFFPGFYKHVPASMRGVAYDGPASKARESGAQDANTVFGHLVQASTVVIAQEHGRPQIELPSRYPQSAAEWELVKNVFRNRAAFGIPTHLEREFVFKMLDLMATCPARRLNEFDDVAWWDYIGADQNEQYAKLLATGLTRTLVAMKAEEANTRTVGDMLIQMLTYAIVPKKASDRVLDGPTSEVWIQPWIAKLEKNVRLENESTVKALEFDGERITAAHIEQAGKELRVTADYFVSAVPVEVMATLVTPEMAQKAPSLSRLKGLHVEWMNGIVYYLNRDTPITHGHIILADSKWALTAISQAQFWDRDLSHYGAGRTKGVLSIDISNWTTAGDQVCTKRADACSALEIAQETWAQIKAHFPELTDADLVAPLESTDQHSWFLDPDINTSENEADDTVAGQAPLRGLTTVETLLDHVERRRKAGLASNSEPLLINKTGSWKLRPEATTEISNLFLASDYVRTWTDLATMEGANEAGRRAVNGILDAANSSAKRCELYPLRELGAFAPFRGIDQLLVWLHLPRMNWHWLWWTAVGVAKLGLWVYRAIGKLRGLFSGRSR
jgi:15-cis-phytoene desaturase